MKFTHVLSILALALSLQGCSRVVQTTSGEEYLSQYTYTPVQPSRKISTLADGTTVETELKSVDQRIREIAAVEPVLRFPARIGLARVSGSTLTVLPAAELENWSALRDRMGGGFGEFVPVNPMVAQMAARSSRGSTDMDGVIDVIRLGAARQHLDAVLIYEVGAQEKTHKNILAIANASIIGGYILPSKLHNATGFGSALLIDVVQGYPYGTLNTVVDKKHRLSSSWGWGSAHDDGEAMAEKIRTQAVKQLSEEAYALFFELRAELLKKDLKKRR